MERGDDLGMGSQTEAMRQVPGRSARARTSDGIGLFEILDF